MRLVQKGKKPQNKYIDKGCYKIEKYAKGHGSNQVAKCFQSKYPTIWPSTSRHFLKKYYEQVRTEKNLNQWTALPITNLTWGRPLMVGPVIDEKVQKLLMALCKKGGHISYRTASTNTNVSAEVNICP